MFEIQRRNIVQNKRKWYFKKSGLLSTGTDRWDSANMGHRIEQRKVCTRQTPEGMQQVEIRRGELPDIKFDGRDCAYPLHEDRKHTDEEDEPVQTAAELLHRTDGCESTGVSDGTGQ